MNNFLLYQDTEVDGWQKETKVNSHNGLITFLAYGNSDVAWTCDVDISSFFNGVIDSEVLSISISSASPAKSVTVQTGSKSFVARITHITGGPKISLVGLI